MVQHCFWQNQDGKNLQPKRKVKSELEIDQQAEMERKNKNNQSKAAAQLTWPQQIRLGFSAKS